MEYRRTSLVVNRQQQAPPNSHIYASFAPPARNSNGSLFDSPTMWWDEDRIEATVNRPFVLSKLRPDEQVRLDEPLGFGDGLTDDTYMEWIETKAKRIFLILVDLGVPDQIFGVIDDSWDDDDLPVPLDQVERLQLTYDRDEKLEKKFFHRQFIYLLRNIQRGEHVYYNDEEVVPLELADKRPVGVAVAGFAQGNVDKVHLPGRPDDVFIRRRIPLGVTPGRLPQEEFLSGIEAMKAIEHDHLMSLWASYSHQGCGYLLLTPVNDSSLKSFLTITPQSVKILAKQDRRILLLNWMHCLADAVSFLHGQGVAHKSIRPANVMLDGDNHIFLGDSGIFPTAHLNGEKQGFNKEEYDYSAPEQAPRGPPTPVVSLPVSRPNIARRSTAPSTGTSWAVSSHSTHTSYSTFPDASSIYTNSTGSSGSPPKSGPFGSKHDPQKADIFSLGAMFLEILTFFFKRTSRNFASHRAAKNKTPGRGGGLPDSSFHKNLGQVESWIAILRKDSGKKEDKVFRGVTRILELTERMMKADPGERPLASEVEDILYNILNKQCELGQTSEKTSRIHCETRNVESNEWNFGFDQLRLASQRAAAEACASVNPVTANGGTLGLNGGVIYGIERTQSVVSNAWPTSPISPSKERLPTRDGDRFSISKSSKSSEGKSRQGSTSQSSGTSGKPKPKVKAWQAPVYAEMSWA